MKWEEMKAIKNERESLFSDFEANKERIADLHFEAEIKKLQYMLLKREQLAAVQKTEKVAIVRESAASVESINETCIKLVQEQLIKYGYEKRLKVEELL